MRTFALLLILSCTFYSCKLDKWSYTTYGQPIRGTSKILYKYDASGGRDSMVSGYILLDSTEKFEVDISKNLPFSYIEKIDNQTIFGVEFEKTDFEKGNIEKEIIKPIKITSLSKQGINITTKLYQNEGFMARNQGFERYQFENFKESLDSLFFYNLADITSLEKKHLEVLGLKKTNVIVSQDSLNYIIKIVVKDLKLSNKAKEIISNTQYSLTPKQKIKSSSLSNYGIFKQKVR